MAVSDIRLQVAFFRHRKIVQLRRRLGADGVLALIELYCHTAETNHKGVLNGMDEEAIAAASGWTGSAKKFVCTLLDLGLLDKTRKLFAIHDWDVHQPWAYKSEQRSATASQNAKKRNYRNEPVLTYESDANGMPTACEQHANVMLPSFPFPSLPILSKERTGEAAVYPDHITVAVADPPVTAAAPQPGLSKKETETEKRQETTPRVSTPAAAPSVGFDEKNSPQRNGAKPARNAVPSLTSEAFAEWTHVADILRKTWSEAEVRRVLRWAITKWPQPGEKATREIVARYFESEERQNIKDKAAYVISGERPPGEEANQRARKSLAKARLDQHVDKQPNPKAKALMDELFRDWGNPSSARGRE